MWNYILGSEEDFDDAPEAATVLIGGGSLSGLYYAEKFERGALYCDKGQTEMTYILDAIYDYGKVLAQRELIDGGGDGDNCCDCTQQIKQLKAQNAKYKSSLTAIFEEVNRALTDSTTKACCIEDLWAEGLEMLAVKIDRSQPEEAINSQFVHSFASELISR